jgi:hypothetical protein
VLLGLLLTSLSTACADGERVNRRDAGSDGAPPSLDAFAPPGVDAFVSTLDAFVPPGADAFVSALDAFVPPGADAYVAPDVFTPGTGRYLDRCTAARDCASGLCAEDRGGTRFCTRECTSDLQCAHEHVCVAGFCLADDTGEPCSVGSPETCATGLCLGSAAGGACTRDCATSAECPAGYACTRVGSPARKVCVDIERSCTAPEHCATGLCVPGLGCTATCEAPSDCPGRLSGLPAYTCGRAYGASTNVCVVPADVVGDDPAGASCVLSDSGLYECRSGACDDSAPLGPMCTTGCTAQGGCGPGLGCFPLVDGGSVLLVCSRAGTRDLGAACGSGRDCASALCDTRGYCTRLCADGLCPTGWRCETVAGFGVALCRR